MNAEDERIERRRRAAERRTRMTVEIVRLGERKPPPYANSTPDERLEAATRLIEHHRSLRGDRSTPPRSEWPGETYVVGGKVG